MCHLCHSCPVDLATKGELLHMKPTEGRGHEFRIYTCCDTNALQKYAKNEGNDISGCTGQIRMLENALDTASHAVSNIMYIHEGGAVWLVDNVGQRT